MLSPSSLAALALALAPAPALRAQDPAPEPARRILQSTPAPEIDATTWYGLEGAPPTLASLRGRAVLLEFWATW